MQRKRKKEKIPNKKMRDIAIFGAGGFGREVACLIRIINESTPEPQWDIIGFFDENAELKGTEVSHYGKVIGGIPELNAWEKELDITIAVGNPQSMKEIAESINNPNINFPNLIAPTTLFLDREEVKFGKGNIVCSKCQFSCNIQIGNFNIFNGQIPVGHDVKMGDYNVVMPSVNISGGVTMGDCNFLGVQSVVLQYIKIGNFVRLAANSVMLRNAKDDTLYLGNPAKKMKL